MNFSFLALMPTDKSSGPSISCPISAIEMANCIRLYNADQIKGLRVIFLHLPYTREVKLLDS